MAQATLFRFDPPTPPTSAGVAAASSPAILRQQQPFVGSDVTVGTEMELQAAVSGAAEDVDLPRVIRASRYYLNLLRQSEAEETPRRAIRQLERYLDDNPVEVWENSWVRVPWENLTPAGHRQLEHDLAADKCDPTRGPRQDSQRFVVQDERGKRLVRVPVSYLLRLALADALGGSVVPPPIVAATGARLLDHFLNDNISPETCSFYVATRSSSESVGKAAAREAAYRFLLVQLLVAWANGPLGLVRTGQRVFVYMSSTPPVRQRQLGQSVSDAFYRETCTNPCLAGWNLGEEKQHYMEVCHEVLSRSRLNAVAKLKDAGILATDLIVLPSLSDVSLANNGTHVTVGSRCLTQSRAGHETPFDVAAEKRFGDLTTKLVEHFLPLFVGTYSAAPSRIDYTDFHAEHMLGFLPHQLHPVHLRMLWRRWRKKACHGWFGDWLAPSGYRWLDRVIEVALRQKGDYVPDLRLIDYFVAPLSTHESPGLDGSLGNTLRLKRDLTELGIFDHRMPLYALFRQRMFADKGYVGFEGRQHSLFPRWHGDLDAAIDLQVMITAVCARWVQNGSWVHADIPDDPQTESERRQAVFACAIDLPTCFVRRDTPNRFLQKLLPGIEGCRSSRRYPGQVRIPIRELRLALVQSLRTNAADLLEQGGDDLLNDLEERIREPEKLSAAGRLTRGVLDTLNVRRPLDVAGRPFNLAAEQYYRHTLRREQLGEAMDLLERDWAGVRMPGPELLRDAARVLGTRSPARFCRDVRDDAVAERLPRADLVVLIQLLLLTVARHASDSAAASDPGNPTGLDSHASPVC